MSPQTPWPPQPPCAHCRQPLAHPMQQTAGGWMHGWCAQHWASGAPAGRTGRDLAMKGCAVALGVGLLAIFILGRVVELPRSEAPVAAEIPAPVTHTLLAEYTTAGAVRWAAVVVPAGTTDAQLCDLARWLHAKDWQLRLQLFDDGAHVAEFVAWARADPSAPQPKPPPDWMVRHHRAVLRSDVDAPKTRLTLYKDIEGRVAIPGPECSMRR